MARRNRTIDSLLQLGQSIGNVGHGFRQQQLDERQRELDAQQAKVTDAQLTESGLRTQGLQTELDETQDRIMRENKARDILGKINKIKVLKNETDPVIRFQQMSEMGMPDGYSPDMITSMKADVSALTGENKDWDSIRAEEDAFQQSSDLQEKQLAQMDEGILTSQLNRRLAQQPKPQEEPKPVIVDVNGRKQMVHGRTGELIKDLGSSDKGKGGRGKNQQTPEEYLDATDDSINAIRQIIGTVNPETGEREGMHKGFGAAVGHKFNFEHLLGLKEEPVSGTKARGAIGLLKQVQGGAFLEAFKNLKGAGHITEVEGKKATQAITRMDAALGEKEFIKAAEEYISVLERGKRRAMGEMLEDLYTGEAATTDSFGGFNFAKYKGTSQ